MNSFSVLGNDVSLLPVSNVGVAKLHAVELGLTKDGMPCQQQKNLKQIGLTKDGMPCQQQKNLKPSAKVLATTTRCKTPTKARVTNVLD